MPTESQGPTAAPRPYPFRTHRSLADIDAEALTGSVAPYVPAPGPQKRRA
jgi:hypothetical protein